MILVICSGAGGVEMLDASAACVFHLLLIFRWVKEVLTLRLQMGFHKAILLIVLCMGKAGHRLGYQARTFAQFWKETPL
jgi:hypothetical protein